MSTAREEVGVWDARGIDDDDGVMWLEVVMASCDESCVELEAEAVVDNENDGEERVEDISIGVWEAVKIWLWLGLVDNDNAGNRSSRMTVSEREWLWFEMAPII